MTSPAAVYPTGSLETRSSHDRATLTLLLSGRVDTNSTGRLCGQALHILQQSRPAQVVIDASSVSELGISEITLKAHRGKVMRKMKADSLPDLVKMSARLGLSASPKQ